MNKLLESGKIWPYAIGVAITLVFFAAIATVIISSKLPVEKSDVYMMGYHQADANANELINARIAFDKKYKIEYITDGLSLDNTVLKYKITTLSDEPVDDAKVMAIITRPNNHKHDQELLNPKIANGIYTFKSVRLAVEGRWNVMAKVTVGDDERFYNVKADTRAKDAYQY